MNQSTLRDRSELLKYYIMLSASNSMRANSSYLNRFQSLPHRRKNTWWKNAIFHNYALNKIRRVPQSLARVWCAPIPRIPANHRFLRLISTGGEFLRPRESTGNTCSDCCNYGLKEKALRGVGGGCEICGSTAGCTSCGSDSRLSGGGSVADV